MIKKNNGVTWANDTNRKVKTWDSTISVTLTPIWYIKINKSYNRTNNYIDGVYSSWLPTLLSYKHVQNNTLYRRYDCLYNHTIKRLACRRCGGKYDITQYHSSVTLFEKLKIKECMLPRHGHGDWDIYRSLVIAIIHTKFLQKLVKMHTLHPIYKALSKPCHELSLKSLQRIQPHKPYQCYYIYCR